MATNVETNASIESAIQWTSQRHTFYASAGSRHWLFYCDDGLIKYKTSSDGGSTWGTSGSVDDAVCTEGNRFSVAFDSTNIHVCWTDETYGNAEDEGYVWYRHGVASSSGTPAWSTDGKQYALTQNLNFKYASPTIGVTDTGYPAIAVRREHVSSGSKKPWLARCDNPYGTWNGNDDTAWTQLHGTDSGSWQAIPIGLTSDTGGDPAYGHFYTVYAYSGSAVYGRLNTGIQQTIDSYVAYADYISVARNTTNDVYVAYGGASRKRDYDSGTWGDEQIIGGNTPVVLSIADDSTLYAFYDRSNDIRYRFNTGLGWSSESDLTSGESNVEYDNIACDIQEYAGGIGVAWVVDDGSSVWRVRFQSLQAPYASLESVEYRADVLLEKWNLTTNFPIDIKLVPFLQDQTVAYQIDMSKPAKERLKQFLIDLKIEDRRVYLSYLIDLWLSKAFTTSYDADLQLQKLALTVGYDVDMRLLQQYLSSFDVDISIEKQGLTLTYDSDIVLVPGIPVYLPIDIVMVLEIPHRIFNFDIHKRRIDFNVHSQPPRISEDELPVAAVTNLQPTNTNTFKISSLKVGKRKMRKKVHRKPSRDD